MSVYFYLSGFAAKSGLFVETKVSLIGEEARIAEMFFLVSREFSLAVGARYGDKAGYADRVGGAISVSSVREDVRH
jgi:hypothetical protein